MGSIPRPKRSSVAQLDGSVLPVDLPLPGIEDVVSHHLEGGEMAAGTAHGIQIIQSDAGLADGQGIRWRRDETAGHKWLEVGDGGDCQVDVVSPAGYHWIAGDPGVAAGLEVAQIMLTHLVQGMLPGKDGIAYEGVGIAWRIPAGLPGLIPGPEGFAAFLALLALESLIHEEVQSILILGEHG